MTDFHLGNDILTSDLMSEFTDFRSDFTHFKSVFHPPAVDFSRDFGGKWKSAKMVELLRGKWKCAHDGPSFGGEVEVYKEVWAFEGELEVEVEVEFFTDFSKLLIVIAFTKYRITCS
ncbi:hypothetical protein SUGI_0063130 [Cryptomeria japonica]|nr:hypothetical protein SUGI_0063130 [Cryptomeria japonica]